MTVASRAVAMAVMTDVKTSESDEMVGQWVVAVVVVGDTVVVAAVDNEILMCGSHGIGRFYIPSILIGHLRMIVSDVLAAKSLSDSLLEP